MKRGGRADGGAGRGGGGGDSGGGGGGGVGGVGGGDVRRGPGVQRENGSVFSPHWHGATPLSEKHSGGWAMGLGEWGVRNE